MSSPTSAQTAAPLVSSQRLPELDGVRGFALSAILVWHYVSGTIDPDIAPQWLQAVRQWSVITWSSIDLFFVLSGYLIGGILLDNRRSPNLFRVFYIRRTLRIMPLYYVWVVLYFVLLATPLAERFRWCFEDPLPAWGYWVYLQNMTAFSEDRFGPHWMGITWSLAVEEQFYLLLPALVFLVPPKWLPLVAAMAVVSATPLRMATAAALPNNEWAAWFPIWCRWDSLFGGVWLAWARRQHWWDATATGPVRRGSYAAMAVLGGWMIVLTALNRIHPGSRHVLTYGLTCISLFYALLLFQILHGGRLARFFAHRWLVFMGTVSYGIYIFHQAILGMLHGLVFHDEPRLHRLDHLAVTVVAVVVTIVLARWSYVYFEKPLVAIGHRWKYAPPPRESGLSQRAEEGR